MNKRQLIDEIQKHNSTASADFLSQFDEEALQQYLEHLEYAQNKNPRSISWVKRGPKLRMVS